MLRRLREVLASDLAWSSQLRYLRELLWRRSGLTASRQGRLNHFELNGGGHVSLRPGTTDFNVLDEIFVQQVYSRFVHLLPEGATIVDLGANVGLSTAYLCRISPESQVIAVEPDPGNFEMLLKNLKNMGIEHRVQAVEAFAGAEPGFASIEDSGHGAWGFRRGKRVEASVRVIPIAQLIDGRGKAGAVSLKCDIEGDERGLFGCLGDWEHLVSLIILELHTELFPLEEFYDALRQSDFEWALHGEILPGASIAVIALERKSRKPSETSAGLAPLYGESTC